MKASPPLCARSRAAASASSTVSPTRRTSAPRAVAASNLPIEAACGMNTSQRTPRVRAAYATAWAWLPALPVTTPASQSSPSAASLASAPRSLNEPVRWRFSALSATVTPVRSASVRELSTGVSRMTPAPAATAARMSAADTDSARAVAESAGLSAISRSRRGEGHDRVHLHLCAPRERGNPDRHPGGRIGFEERCVDLVDGREGGHVDQVDRHLDRVSERRPRGVADGGQVLQAAAGLVGRAGPDQVTGPGIQRDLARAEQQPPETHPMNIRADRRGGIGGGDRLSVSWHRLFLPSRNRSHKRIARSWRWVAWGRVQSPRAGELPLPVAA